MNALRTATFAAFGLALAATAPASLLAPVLERQNVEFEKVEGSIWRGKVVGARIGDINLGDVGFRFSPLDLVGGGIGYRIESAGRDLDFRGVVSASPFSRRIKIGDAVVRFRLGAIRRYSLFGLPYQGELNLDIASLDWSKNGCVQANARISTDIFDALSRENFSEPMILTGASSCDGGELAANLQGANILGEVVIDIVLGPDYSYELRATATPKRPEAKEGLRQAGFQEDAPGEMRYDAVGVIKGLGV